MTIPEALAATAEASANLIAEAKHLSDALALPEARRLPPEVQDALLHFQPGDTFPEPYKALSIHTLLITNGKGTRTTALSPTGVRLRAALRSSQ